VLTSTTTTREADVCPGHRADVGQCRQQTIVRGLGLQVGTLEHRIGTAARSQGVGAASLNAADAAG
jgi:hypothetical protein